MQKANISKKMNLLYMAVDPSLYTHSYSAGKAYPHAMYPFLDNAIERPILPPAPTTMNTLLQRLRMQSSSKFVMMPST
jgi:hypothetical protein